MRFRVAARKTVYFQSRMAKKGPQYLDCNERQSTCTRRKANPRKGCPDCEYTIQYNYFKDELEKELRFLPNTTRQGMSKWPMSYLLEIVSEVASVSYSTKGRDKNWPVPLALLVSIYRDEHSKMKAISNYVPPTETAKT